MQIDKLIVLNNDKAETHNKRYEILELLKEGQNAQ